MRSESLILIGKPKLREKAFIYSTSHSTWNQGQTVPLARLGPGLGPSSSSEPGGWAEVLAESCPGALGKQGQAGATQPEDGSTDSPEM